MELKRLRVTDENGLFKHGYALLPSIDDWKNLDTPGPEQINRHVALLGTAMPRPAYISSFALFIEYDEMNAWRNALDCSSYESAAKKGYPYMLQGISVEEYTAIREGLQLSGNGRIRASRNYMAILKVMREREVDISDMHVHVARSMYMLMKVNYKSIPDILREMEPRDSNMNLILKCIDLSNILSDMLESPVGSDEVRAAFSLVTATSSHYDMGRLIANRNELRYLLDALSDVSDCDIDDLECITLFRSVCDMSRSGIIDVPAIDPGTGKSLVQNVGCLRRIAMITPNVTPLPSPISEQSHWDILNDESIPDEWAVSMIR